MHGSRLFRRATCATRQRPVAGGRFAADRSLRRAPRLWRACLLAAALAPPAVGLEPCRIDVVDQATGWPVPLVALETTHGVRFVSDNRGVIAFDLPELMHEPTWFAVEGHGYGVPADGSGYRGVQLTPTPGGRLTVAVARQLPARRLGRLTGGGLFAEAQRFGLDADWRESRILGCDSVQTAVCGDQRLWLWGDATLARHPLGLFHMTGALTAPRPLSAFEPPLRLDYDYLVEPQGRPRVVAPMPGPGPTWLTGLASLPDATGRPRLGAYYYKITPPLTPYETGLCVWNEELATFEHLATLWSKSATSPEAPPGPTGHAVPWTDPEGNAWVLFGDGFPHLQCAPRFEAWRDPAAWRLATPQRDAERRGGGRVAVHRASIGYSGYRRRWVAIFNQSWGAASAFGEVWYAESDQPWGPWGNAVQVATHPGYTFYNPRLHVDLTPPESPLLLFEGTFANAFSGTQAKMPRFDYNQVLYRLDLDDLPAADDPAPTEPAGPGTDPPPTEPAEPGTDPPLTEPAGP